MIHKYVHIFFPNFNMSSFAILRFSRLHYLTWALTLIVAQIRRTNRKPLALGWLTSARLQQCASSILDAHIYHASFQGYSAILGAQPLATA